jgi:hypothetical protein
MWALDLILPIVFAAFVTATTRTRSPCAHGRAMIRAVRGRSIQVAGSSTSGGPSEEAIEGFHDLGDDEASPLDARPSALDDAVDPDPTRSTARDGGRRPRQPRRRRGPGRVLADDVLARLREPGSRRGCCRATGATPRRQAAEAVAAGGRGGRRRR